MTLVLLSMYGASTICYCYHKSANNLFLEELLFDNFIEPVIKVVVVGPSSP